MQFGCAPPEMSNLNSMANQNSSTSWRLSPHDLISCGDFPGHSLEKKWLLGNYFQKRSIFICEKSWHVTIVWSPLLQKLLEYGKYGYLSLAARWQNIDSVRESACFFYWLRSVSGTSTATTTKTTAAPDEDEQTPSSSSSSSGDSSRSARLCSFPE